MNENKQEIKEVKVKVKRVNYAHSLRYAKHIDNALLAINEASKSFTRDDVNNEVNKHHYVRAIADKCSLSESTSRDVLCTLLKNHAELKISNMIYNALLSTQAHSHKRLIEKEKAEKEAKIEIKKV